MIEQAQAESQLAAPLQNLVFRNSRNSKSLSATQNIPVHTITDI